MGSVLVVVPDEHSMQLEICAARFSNLQGIRKVLINLNLHQEFLTDFKIHSREITRVFYT